MNKLRYSMESPREADRLEKQALLPAYQISKELQSFEVQPGERVLDAGCGSGILSRFLVDRFPGATVEGCDVSPTRLEGARSLCQQTAHQKIRFFESNLESVASESSVYDGVVCRFVLEHVTQPSKIVSEFHRILKTGGTLQVIDWDGIVLNLFPASEELSGYLQTMQTSYPGDFRIGRKIPALLENAGFRNVQWRIETVDFQGIDLEAEIDQTEQRLNFAKPLLTEIFGSEVKAQRFKKLYCQEMKKPGATLFYNKFIVSATK